MSTKEDRRASAARQRAWRAASPAKVKASKARYMMKHRTRVLKTRRQQRIQQTYGLSPSEYASLVERCGNRCQICGGPPGGRWNKVYVDHDHNNGRIRGMLCINCNLAIGYLGDSPERAEAVVSYLRRGGKIL